MALSMEEEQILSEIASRLGDDDPALADRLTNFGRRRIRTAVAVFAALVVIASLVAAAFVTAGG